jgi:hypothetical protein
VQVSSCRRRLRQFSKIGLASNKNLLPGRPLVTELAGVREAIRTAASVVDAGFIRKANILRLNVCVLQWKCHSHSRFWT